VFPKTFVDFAGFLFKQGTDDRDFLLASGKDLAAGQAHGQIFRIVADHLVPFVFT
jgi:hypothetical protein